MVARTTPEYRDEPNIDRRDASTRSLLGCGVLVGPFYLAIGLIQALVRDGFDLLRHPLSLLANGTGGWIQTANFVLSGLLVIAAAVGIRRMLGPRWRSGSWFLGSFGASMLVAAVFPADPVDGFPPGTPEGPPTSISTTGLVHFIAGALGFISLAISCFLTASAMSRRNMPSLARLSFLGGAAIILGFFGGAALSSSPAGVLGIWFSVIVGWAWLTLISLHLYRAAPTSHVAPPEAST